MSVVLCSIKMKDTKKIKKYVENSMILSDNFSSGTNKAWQNSVGFQIFSIVVLCASYLIFIASDTIYLN